MTATKQDDTPTQVVLPDHTSIYAAIAASAREVRVIGKSERNKFDGYDFASIDKFLMLVNPICGRNGLFPIIAQREVEFYDNVNSKGGKSVWARFFFDVTLYHSTGQTLGPVNMMVAVPMNGAQTSGSAQSYALKQFFRSTLMIPTGDKDDADLNATETHRSTPPAASKPQTVTPDQYIKLRDTAEAAGVPAEKICAAYDALSFEEFPADAYNSAMSRLQLTLDGLKTATPAADLDGDSIPYEGK
jgi:hypothetical protein